ATAPTKPRWSAIGSPEADARREPAPPDRHTKTTPPRARQIPASLPPGRYPQIRESRRRPKLYGFFNSLLTVVIAAEMFYLELRPFKFRMPVNGHGALRKLLETWADRPEPGDFI